VGDPAAPGDAVPVAGAAAVVAGRSISVVDRVADTFGATVAGAAVVRTTVVGATVVASGRVAVRMGMPVAGWVGTMLSTVAVWGSWFDRRLSAVRTTAKTTASARRLTAARAARRSPLRERRGVAITHAPS
jgi:hypothetical protein